MTNTIGDLLLSKSNLDSPTLLLNTKEQMTEVQLLPTTKQVQLSKLSQLDFHEHFG